MLPRMDVARTRIERALERAFNLLDDRDGPPQLATALRYAVFPGGARLRPQLTLAVAEALGDPEPRVTEAAAAALELVHCGSLVHDDLPCFDDANLRRGRDTVHVAFDEPTAVLVGDGLIVMAFQTIASARPSDPARIAALVKTLSKGVGHPHGIIAGQAWESQPGVALITYHSAKTAALFEAACALGAIAAGADPAPWRKVGELLGRAYQVADDLVDATATEEETGKTGQRDVQRGRPSAFRRLGAEGCRDLLDQLLAEAAESVPPCAGQSDVRTWLVDMSLGVLKVRTSAETATPKKVAAGGAP
jgi:geranylgeranyl diphosphate synthase type II